MTLANAIEYYIQAKDYNRPHLIKIAFANSARVTMDVQTDVIDFPSALDGTDEIADALVRNFSLAYSNVYTFCLTDPPSNTEIEMNCDWLVVMSERDHDFVRVGCGHYMWQFDRESMALGSLGISIEQMQILPSHTAEQSLLNWASGLKSPWCSRQTLLNTAPALDGMDPVWDYLR
ncbi:MAG: hypothetical protein KAG66_23440, partial [Methylococcales bacterium]|nr:hypothetical protein [Methylococcales bacterium]